MSDYKQPEFYKFGSDSLELVQFIHRYASGSRALEVGTGCGIISLELAQLRTELSIDALEPQVDFKDYYLENNKFFGDGKVTFYQHSIESFFKQYSHSYDFAFFNPPYFWSGESRAAQDDRRDRCRRMDKKAFLHWFELLEGIPAIFLCLRDVEFINSLQKWNIKESLTIDGCALIYLTYDF